MSRTIQKKKRFLIFERDNFTCQYCGRRPDQDTVVLHVDHVISVHDGGTSDDQNLITSCADCNLGKGKISVLKKTKTVDDLETDILNAKERLDQLKEMNKRRSSLKKVEQNILAQQTVWIEEALGDYANKDLVLALYTSYEKQKLEQGVFAESMKIALKKHLSSPFSNIKEFVSYSVGVYKNLSLTEEQQAILFMYNANIFTRTRMLPPMRKMILNFAEFGADFHRDIIVCVQDLLRTEHMKTFALREEAKKYFNYNLYTVYRSGFNLHLVVADVIVMKFEEMIDGIDF